MSEVVSVAEAVERGRYAVYGDSPMNFVLARVTDLCDSCASCGCGTPQEEIRGADLIKEFLKNPLKLGNAIKGLIPGGG